MQFLYETRPLVEQALVPDIYASGIGKLEIIDKVCIRLTFYVVQDGERVVVAKIVRPIASVIPHLLDKAVQVFEPDLALPH